MRSTAIAALAAVSILALGACNKQAATSSDNAAASGNASTTAAGADAIDGTWVTDLSTAKVTSSKPMALLLKDGTFSCSTCTPPLTVAADGAFHPVTGRPYADEISVKVDDDHNVTRIGKKGGKETGVTKYTVSADGKSLAINFKDETTTPAVTGTGGGTRVGDAPPGAHLLSGSWNMNPLSGMSKDGLTTTYKRDGDVLHMTSPVGISFDAKLDGTPTPEKGDISHVMVSVKQLSDGSYQETDTRDGKVISVTTTSVSPDGKMHVTNEDKLSSTTVKVDATKS